MHTFGKICFSVVLPLACACASAQSASADDVEALKITALEALMSAPPERALPIVEKVLAGNSSDEIKERALFILSQIDLPAAQTILLEAARQGGGEMQLEAIRMIGIGGNPEALAGLIDVYGSGDEDVRESVLEAYLIAGDPQSIYQIAVNADNEDDYLEAVEILGAMGAHGELRELRNTRGASEALIEAYAISDDAESLRKLALDTSDPELQEQAIEALGIIGGPEIQRMLVDIYQSTDAPDVREAALEGLLIAGHDDGILELYRASDNAAEKKALLEYLVMMDNEAVWNLIDSALDGQH